jgi:alkylation response protein AidB-like acyl-CoA dehydrogenase
MLFLLASSQLVSLLWPYIWSCGAGYLYDYPLAGMYADARVTRIYGGSSEIMKLVVVRWVFEEVALHGWFVRY